MNEIAKKKNNRGFYLIEAIIALFLLTVGLLVTTDLLTKTISGNIKDRENATAVLLSQEGIELVRSLRDNNFAQGKDAFDTQYFPGSTSSNCRMDKDDSRVICGSAYALKLSNHFYVHSGGTATKFQRRISIEYTGSGEDRYATVTSAVTWDGSAPPNSLTNCNAAHSCAYVQVVLTAWD